MTIATFPAITPNSCEWGLQANTQNARSELNGTVQTLALPGDIWTGTLTFTNKVGAQANMLRAFLASLRGQAGRFTITPPGYNGPDASITALWASGGIITTSAICLTADSTLITADSTISIDMTYTYWLAPGDYFEVLGELKMVTASVLDFDAGTCAISFVPPLRQDVPYGTSIITDKPTCIAMLKDPNQARWQMQPGILYAMSIAIEEAIF